MEPAMPPLALADPALAVGEATEGWAGDAEYFEYTRAANPVGSGRVPPVPLARFDAERHRAVATGVVAFDLRDQLSIPHDVEPGPATSPALCASFVRIAAGAHVTTSPVATSELYYVMSGRGRTTRDGEPALEWSVGDFFVLPGGVRSSHAATDDATLYWVTDEPLLRYLGVAPVHQRFRPTRFPAARCESELAAIAGGARAGDRNRIAVLLATAPNTQTQTVTHVLWAMYGLVPAGAVQRAHRHQSVALDLVVDCDPGCYTLVGSRLDADGEIVRPERVDWSSGGAFVTPPGLWHEHHNESDRDARIVPIQDAGLHAHLRSLDIRFAPPRA
jgi:gentisate 1,2-dioxygenase